MFPQRFVIPFVTLLLVFSNARSPRALSGVQPATLKPGETIAFELRPGQAESLLLTLTPLDFARLAVSTGNRDLTIKISNPAGKTVLERELSRDTTATAISFVAGYWGAFRLEVASREKEELLEKVEIKFAERRAVVAADADRIAAEEAFAEGERFRAREVNEERRPAIARYEDALARWRKLGDRDNQARALLALGRVHDNLNLGDQAMAYFNQALAIRRETGERGGEAAALAAIAGLHNNRGERQKAAALFEQALAIRRELQDRRSEASLLHNLGSVQQGLNQRPRAIEYYEQAMRIRAEIRDRRGEAASLFQIGVTSAQMGQFNKADEAYQKVLPIFQSLDDKRNEAVTLSSIGALRARQGKRREAIEYLDRARQTQQAVGARRQEAASLSSMGSIYDEMGEKQKALEHHNRALEIRREINDQPGIALSLLGIGSVHESLGDNQRALDYYNQARPVRRATAGPLGEAEVLNNIGSVHSEMGDRQSALNHHQQALSLWQQANFPQGQAAALTRIGLLYNALGERRLALDFLNQALEIRRRLRNPIEEAKTLTSIGVVTNALEDRSKAIEYFEQAMKLGQEDATVTAYALNARALVHQELDEDQQALALLDQALPLARKAGDRWLEADTLHNLGWVWHGMKDLPRARDLLNQSLAIYRGAGSRASEASTLFALANVESDADDLKAARDRIEAAITIAESLRAGLGSTELRASYFASVQKYYDLYIEVLMKLAQQKQDGRLEAEAFQAAERARARSLLDLLNESGADIRRGADPVLVGRERDLQQQLNAKAARAMQLRLARAPAAQIEALEAEIQRLNADYQTLQSGIRSTSPRYAALTQPRPLSVREIQQQALDRDTLLLEYALGERQSYLWAVTPDSLHTYSLPKRETIEDAAREVYDLLTERNHLEEGESETHRKARIAKADARFQAAAARLSRMLLGPVRTQLGDKRLLIVAQGALQYIPFAALPSPGTSRQGGRQTGQGSASTLSSAHRLPLIARHEIVSLPSASTLAALRRETEGRQPAEKTLAVFADPVFEKDDERVKSIGIKLEAAPRAPDVNGTRLLKHTSDRFPGRIPRLPFTRREAENILALVPEAERRLALDFQASRAAVNEAELSRYRYLHFATHGLLDSQNPELSSLVLSLVNESGTQQDGFLRAMEVYNLNLPAEAVVLSACETGLGKQIKGEGLVGLTRGFMYAGAPRVIVSLWAVNDQATAELMTRLYQKMLKENLRPAAALRAAQIEMLGQPQWRSPYFWAAFSAQGEWR